MKIINKFLQEDRELDHSISVKAIIKRGDHILILRRSLDGAGGGMWDLPGGAIEKGEDKEDALKREVFEETGLKIDNIKFVNKDILKIPEQGVKSEMNIYTCDGDSVTVNLKPSTWRGSNGKPEHGEYKWIEKRSDLINLPMLKLLRLPLMEELK